MMGDDSYAPPAGIGCAVDLGTTTIAVSIIDCAARRSLGTSVALNRQRALGSDLLTRIAYINAHQNARTEATAYVLESIREAVTNACAIAGVEPTALVRYVVAGNTAMQQLLLGMPVDTLATPPFAPAFTTAQTRSVAALNLPGAPHASLTVFPQIGGFVGGDTLAGLLSVSFKSSRAPMLYIDLGTNSEIILRMDGRISVASTSADPAFEGASIQCGMIATAGAIDRVSIEDGELYCHVVGNVAATGMCGSGIVDAVAELLRVGMIDRDGRLVAASNADLNTRLIQHGAECAFVLAHATDNTPDVLLMQSDIRKLQIAKAAIRAGIDRLLAQREIAPDQLGAVYVAGGIGLSIRFDNAQRIGLLPTFSSRIYKALGNTTLLGAARVLCDPTALDVVDAMRATATHVDLATLPDFKTTFTHAMQF